MRKVVLKMSITVDGFVGTPDGNVDWIFPSVDPEVTQWLVGVLGNAGTHIMGRTLYQDMAAYWPSSKEPYAAPMNDIPKVVFSRTLENAEWQGSRIANGELSEELVRLKQEQGGYILVHGGSSFAQALAEENLIDEYCLLVHPVALGHGRRLFASHHDLKLVRSKIFSTGAIALTYQPSSDKI